MNENAIGQSRGGKGIWPPYHWIQPETSYAIFDDFWEAKYNQNDNDAYERYLKILGLSRQGLNASAIEKQLGANNVRKYLSGTKRSFLTHLRAEHERIGPPPAKLKWSPVRLKPRGTPDSTWIAVPAEISNYHDIVSVIDQRTPTEESFKVMNSFGYSSKEELLRDRVNMFGVVLGVMLGDAIKPPKGSTRFPSMTVALTLSKRKPNSFRFGEFTALCINSSVGLAMHRIADAPSSTGRYTDAECYQWLSPASPLIGWVFKVCMGLKDGETTTYNPVRMNWILDAPRDFQVSVLQGMSESDGWVDAGADRAKFVSSPNEKLFGSLFDGFDIPYKIYQQRQITRIEIRTKDAWSLPIFSPRIRSNNYNNLVTMANAKRFPPRQRIPYWFIKLIQPILTKPIEYNQMCLEIAATTGFKIDSATAKKYTPQAIRTTNSSPPSFFLLGNPATRCPWVAGKYYPKIRFENRC